MIRTFFILLTFMLTTAPASAQVQPVTIHNAHAYQTVTVQKNGAVYLRVDNIADESDVMIAAEADVSERVELHTHIMDGGIMMMREVPGFDLAPKGEILLEPMGDHIMLMDLKAPLKVGQTFPMIVVFEKAGRLETMVEVRSIKDMPMHGGGKMRKDSSMEDAIEDKMNQPADSQKIMYKKPVNDGHGMVSEEVER